MTRPVRQARFTWEPPLITKFLRDDRNRWRRKVVMKQLRNAGHLFNRGVAMLWWAVGGHRRPNMPSPPPCWQWHQLYSAYVSGNREADKCEMSTLKWQRSFRDINGHWDEKKKTRLRHLKHKARRQKRLERWKAARKEKRLAAASEERPSSTS